MTLEEGINVYVQRRRTTGISFAKGDSIFRAFGRMVGNISLSRINADHISKFLNRPNTSTRTFRRDHSLLSQFVDYWTAHGAMDCLHMPPNRPPQRSHFLPYIYTREEIRRLLNSAHLTRTPRDQVHHNTLRAAVLTLYATGATVGEVARLATNDVDLDNRAIKFSGSLRKAARTVPMGTDFARAIRQYLKWQARRTAQSEYLFNRTNGSRIGQRAFDEYFGRLRQNAGIAGYYGSSRRPCLQDLRATFAVHQITSWIKRKRDLNVMLPALAAYMGYVGLESTERYLQLTPERFRHALNKLSPQKLHTRWREDSALLDFLSDL